MTITKQRTQESLVVAVEAAIENCFETHASGSPDNLMYHEWFTCNLCGSDGEASIYGHVHMDICPVVGLMSWLMEPHDD